MPLRRLAAHPVSHLLRASLLTQLALVVSGPLAVRLLGVEARGELALVFAVVLLTSQVGVAGFPQALAYFMARDRIPAAQLIGRFRRSFAVQVGLVSVVGLLAVVVLAGLGDGLSSPATEALLVGLGVAIVMAAILVLASLQGEQRFVVLARLQLVPAMLYAVVLAVVLALPGSRSVAFVLAANLTGWLLVALVGRWLVLRGGPATPAPARVLPTSSRVWHYARRAMVTSAAPIDNLAVDQLLIGILLTHRDLGNYVIGYAFETAPVLAMLAIANVVAPQLAAADPSQHRRIAVKWLLRAAVLGLAVGAAIQVVLAPVLTLAFGPGTADAIPLGRILVVAGVFLGLRRVGAAALNGIGRPGHAAAAEGVGLLVLVAGIASTASRWGAEGAAVSLLAAGLVALLVQVVLLSLPAGDSSRRAVPAGRASTP